MMRDYRGAKVTETDWRSRAVRNRFEAHRAFTNYKVPEKIFRLYQCLIS